MIRYTAEGTGTTFAELIRYLEQYRKILDKHAFPSMQKTVRHAHDHILPRIPVRTGAARGVFFNSVLGFGDSLTGVVGFEGGTGKPYYINIVEYGARSHSLVKGSKQRSRAAFARFQKRAEKGGLVGAHVNINGQWTTITKHPGFSKRGFMAAGFSAAQPVFNAMMQQAADNAFKEIAS